MSGEREADQYLAGLHKAHRLLSHMHMRLAFEHKHTRGHFFGLFPTRRHDEIIGASNALVQLGFDLLRAGEEHLRRTTLENSK